MPKKNYAYVDGSFNEKLNIYGYGAFLIDQNGEKHILKGYGKKDSMRKMRNVAGEILGATMVIKKALKLGMKTLTLYHDYEGIRSWALGSWKTNKKDTEKYAEFVKKAMDDGLNINFRHVKGHAGIPGNELADLLAKEAVKLK